MRSLPFDKAREVVRLKLSGFSDREVGRRSGVSHTAVSSVFQVFKDRAAAMGLMKAGGEYGVAEQTAELVEIAELRRRTGLGFSEVMLGAGVGRLWQTPASRSISSRTTRRRF